MVGDNAFSIDPATEAENSRRNKLGGLYGLQRYANDPGQGQDAASLSEQPLYGGETSKAAAQASADEPSQLATERVVRAPMTRQEASPLLPPEQRLGNVLTGEEGTYGPLSSEQRSVSLKDFFKPQAPAQQSQQQPPSTGASDQPAAGASASPAAGPDEVSKDLGLAKQATGYASTLEKASGGRGGRALRDLFNSGGAGTGPAYPSGLSLSGAEAAGPQYSSGLSLTGGESTGGIPSGDHSLGVSPFSDTGAGAGPSLGAGLGASASLLGLIASIYGLATGAKVTPEMLLGILQGGVGTTSQIASLAGSTAGAASGATGGASSLAGLAGAVAPGLGLIAGVQNIGDAANKIMTHDPRMQYDAYSQLVGGPGAGYLSHLITQNMVNPNAALNRSLGASGLAIENYQRGLSDAAQSGDIRQLQQALSQMGNEEWGRGASSIGVHLSLPTDVAQAIGVNPDAQFSDLSPDQFVKLIKAYSERSGVNQGWFTGTADMPHFRADSGPGPNVVRALSGTADSVFNELAKVYGPALDQMPSVAPLTWENVNPAYRVSPQLQYSAVDTVNRGQDQTSHPIDYATLKDLLTSGGNAKNPMLMGGGVPVNANWNAEPFDGSTVWGEPTSPFAADPNAAATLRGLYQSYLERLSPAYRSDYVQPAPGGDQ